MLPDHGRPTLRFPRHASGSTSERSSSSRAPRPLRRRGACACGLCRRERKRFLGDPGRAGKHSPEPLSRPPALEAIREPLRQDAAAASDENWKQRSVPCTPPGSRDAAAVLYTLGPDLQRDRRRVADVPARHAPANRPRVRRDEAHAARMEETLRCRGRARPRACRTHDPIGAVALISPLLDDHRHWVRRRTSHDNYEAVHRRTRLRFRSRDPAPASIESSAVLRSAGLLYNYSKRGRWSLFRVPRRSVFHLSLPLD